MADHIKVKIVAADGQEYCQWALRGQTAWETLELMGWDTGGSCGGQHKCGKCKFRIEGSVNDLSEAEKEMLLTDEIKNGQRLACYCRIQGEATIHIDYWPAQSKAKSRLKQVTQGEWRQSQVSTRSFFIAGRQKDSPVPIYDRIKGALNGYRLELSIENLNQLAKIDRPGRPALELHAVILDQRTVPCISRHKPGIYGVALDIGSTSLWGALLDMENGQIVAMSSQNNMQRIYGDDIISRISYCMEHEDGAQTLHRILINNLNSMMEEMLDQAGAGGESIYKMVAVGNPVMLHFLLNVDVMGFKAAPYAGLFSREMEYPAVKLNLKVNPHARLSLLPQLGGFIGADTTACLLSLPRSSNSSFLMIDLGTNCEIVLCHQDKIWAASAAAGPAFEGGNISCGIRAGSGAIDQVYISDGEMRFNTIGEKARGLCGSGIIDLVAVLLEAGFIDERGSFTARAYDHLNISEGQSGPEIILMPGEETDNNLPLVFTQQDVRQVQLAKGAVRTAIDILLRQARLQPGKLHDIYLAGTFGSYLRPANLLLIGMIPKVDLQIIKNIGNAAALGAIMALRDDVIYDEAAQIKKVVQCVELAEQSDFQKLFLENINFIR